MSDDDPSLIGQIKDKLLKSKEAWAREGRLLTGKAGDRADRLPPGQHLVKNWPVLDLGIQPDVPKDVWSLALDGAVVLPDQVYMDLRVASGHRFQSVALLHDGGQSFMKTSKWQEL